MKTMTIKEAQDRIKRLKNLAEEELDTAISRAKNGYRHPDVKNVVDYIFDASILQIHLDLFMNGVGVSTGDITIKDS